jgi:L,D-peptidoglycan transpeptidase YkuD (ErfK/YbiS/YcfS/YnhG family)
VALVDGTLETVVLEGTTDPAAVVTVVAVAPEDVGADGAADLPDAAGPHPAATNARATRTTAIHRPTASQYVERRRRSGTRGWPSGMTGMTAQRKGRRRQAVAGSAVLAGAAAGGALMLLAGCGHERPTRADNGAAPPTTSAHAAALPPVPTGPTTTTTRAHAPLPSTTQRATPTTPPTTTKATATTAPPAVAAHAATACTPTLATSLAYTGRALQLVTVVAPTPTSTSVTVALWQRQGPCWVGAGGPWAGVIGASGFSDHHREGDNTTPTGIYAISPVVYGNAPNPGVRGTYHQLVCGDWWDEDPTSAAYNAFQYVPCGTVPRFAGDSEALWAETEAYPSFAVVEYNTDPAVPYAGSAIFVHANIGGPTAGCVSIPRPDLDQMLRWLNPPAQPVIAMGPAGEITRF